MIATFCSCIGRELIQSGLQAPPRVDVRRT
jgi:hypothetical protein